MDILPSWPTTTGASVVTPPAVIVAEYCFIPVTSLVNSVIVAVSYASLASFCGLSPSLTKCTVRLTVWVALSIFGVNSNWTVSPSKL